MNVYYKPGHPGVGSYDIDTNYDHIRGCANFNSKTKKTDLFKPQSNSSIPIQYDNTGTFGMKPVGNNNSPGFCQPTTRKLVHLDLFGQEKEGDKSGKK